MGMQCPTYHDPARASINLAQPWHSVAEEIAHLNFNIVIDKLNKGMKSCHQARPWGPKDFFPGVVYHTHNLNGYVPKPQSLVIPSRPPPQSEQQKTSHFSCFTNILTILINESTYLKNHFPFMPPSYYNMRLWPGKLHRLSAMLCLQPNMFIINQRSLKNPGQAYTTLS